MEKYYSVREAMEILHRSNATIRFYIRSGLLPAKKLKPDAPNSKFIISETDLKAFIENGVPRGAYQATYPRPHKRDTGTE